MALNLPMLKKQTFILTLVLFITFKLNAQDRSNYSLLWKIEGKEQLKPSYLFGTMHVDDARVFDFSDAVLPAIENTEKFALEIQPDSLMIKLFSKPTKTKAYLQFKKLLNTENYTKIAKRFKEVNGYDIETSAIKDPNILISMLSPDDDKASDKATFVDMHLLGHAKTMQKDIIGLEDIDSQINYFENATEDRQREMLLEALHYDTSTYLSEIEALKKVYITGDINAINTMVMPYNGYGKEMEERNIVMTNSIIKEMKDSSVFSAVGAAHLPGKVGLIKMLRDKGYTVTPVEANFTGVSKTYNIDNSKMKWHSFTDTDLGFTVETPGISGLESTNKNLKIYVFTDLTTKTNYSFFALDFRLQKELTKDILFKRIIDNSAERYNAEVLTERLITIDGVESYEVILKMKEVSDPNLTGLKFVFTFKNGIFYQFIVLDKIEKLNSENAVRFFNSIKLHNPEPLTKKKWLRFESGQGAFSVDFPDTPIDKSKEVDSPYEDAEEPYYLKMYTAYDPENRSKYLMRYNDIPNGYYLNDLDAAFASMSESFTSKAELIGKPKTIYHEGYIGKQYELLISGLYHSICKVFFRGNRTYLLLSQKIDTGEKTNPDNKFLKSFEFKDFLKEEVVLQEKEDFVFKSFKNTRTLRDENYDNSDEYTYNSVDHYTKNESTGDVYLFGYSKLKPYFKIDTLHNFYDLYKKELTQWTDTIIDYKKINVKHSDGIEFTIMSTQDSILSKYLLWLDHDTFFYTGVFAAKENINSELTNEILYGYTPKDNTKKFDYYSSKTTRLLKDLKTKDSIIFKQAIGAFNYYEFDPNDVSQLYKAIDETYASEENRITVIKNIVNELIRIDTTDTLPLLENIYTNYSVDEETKRNIIQNIPNLKDKNSLEVYKKLLFSDPPKAEDSYYNYSTFSPFFDSIPMAIENYKALTELNTSKRYRKQILDLSQYILKTAHKNDIITYFNEITKDSKTDLQSYIQLQKNSDEYNYSEHSLIYSYLEYFKEIPKATNVKTIADFTKVLLKLNANKWMTLKTAETRVLHHLKLSGKLKNTLLDSVDTRFDLMKAYHQANRLNEVSEKFYDENEFSRVSLKQYLEAIEEYPDKRVLLGKLTIDSVLYYAYELKYEYENLADNTSYLALVRVDYKVTQAHELNLYKVVCDWDVVNTDWKAQAKELVALKDENTVN
ncbi:TraB/GumN family protein [Lacinutrix sp. Hel_I_90]|uniref:TraB/GumN family protein n=1 Tax=Lacinutrix sp. Hel_I_90 TaxID=1249999 RepID=UPI0005CB7298|nr:TraB/GumN family protein [Lacinutrix sp. Hel_I_90]